MTGAAQGKHPSTSQLWAARVLLLLAGTLFLLGSMPVWAVAAPTVHSATTSRYDGYGRLVWQQEAPIGGTLTWAVTGGSTTTVTYAANQLRRVGNTYYRYDKTGNRIQRYNSTTGEDIQYLWDRLGRLRGANRIIRGQPESTRQHWAFGYDHRTRRIYRQGPSTTGAPALVEIDSYSGGTSISRWTAATPDPLPANRTLTHETIRGSDFGGGVGGVLYTIDAPAASGTRRFYGYGARGDVTSQSDAAGAPLFRAVYQAFGNYVASGTAGPGRQRASTKEEEGGLGLLNEGFRYRETATGAFLSRDPAGFVDGPNLYAYVRQNPWSAFDPEGLFLEVLVEKFGDFVGYALEETGAADAITNMIVSSGHAESVAAFDAKYDVGAKLEATRDGLVAAGEMISPVSSDALRAAGRGDGTALVTELARSKLKVVDKAMNVMETGKAAMNGDVTSMATSVGSKAKTKVPAKKSGGGQCFPAGTAVWTLEGLAAIETIRPGDRILTRSLEMGEPVVCEVTRVFVHEYEGELVTLTLSGGCEITSTGNHPFRVLAGESLESRPLAVDAGSDAAQTSPSGARWVEATDLRPGDLTWTASGPQAITKISRRFQSATVYNLGVATERTYLVGGSGILVHNKTMLDDLGGGGGAPSAQKVAADAEVAARDAKPLKEWLKDDQALLDEARSMHQSSPEWQGIDPDTTDVSYRSKPEVDAIRAKPGESGGHHPHGLALGGPEGQKLTPTGETRKIKNPQHSQATGLQRRIINRIKKK